MIGFVADAHFAASGTDESFSGVHPSAILSSMAVVVGILIGGALLVTLAGAVFTDIKIFGLAREQRQGMVASTRRQVDRMMATIFVLASGFLAFLFVMAPFGRRDTVIWFLIVPFLVCAPLGTIAAAVRGRRRDRNAGSAKHAETRSSRRQAPH